MRNIDLAIKLIKAFEGIPDGDPSTVKLDPYLDPVGIWTIGWGHALRDANGNFIQGKANKAQAQAQYPGGITLLEAEILLGDDLRPRIIATEKAVKVPINDHQFCALLDFVFNLGIGALLQSTLLKRLNKGDYAIENEFPKWNKAKGKVLKGLTRRRKAEVHVWKTGKFPVKE